MDYWINGGLVTLEGSVDTYWKKVYAEDLASHIRGVVHIANKLTVVPTKRIVDGAIAREIMAALDRNVAVDSDSITVEVENSVVTLSGIQRSRAAKTAVFFTAVYTNGITHIHDRVTVKRPWSCWLIGIKRSGMTFAQEIAAEGHDVATSG